MKPSITSATAIAALVLNGSLSAATIANVSRSDVDSGTAVFNLTTIGSSDWAIWNTASGTPGEEKSGASLISTATVIGTGSLRTSTSGTNTDFSWSDGSTIASSSRNNVQGIFSTVLDTVGEGVGLTITLPTTDTYRISIWTAGYNSISTLTASLTGATNYVDEATGGVDNPKDSFYYTFDVTPDNANDVLNISNVLTTDPSATSSHAIITGAAIGIVPEPSSALLLGIAGMGLLLRRRAH